MNSSTLRALFRLIAADGEITSEKEERAREREEEWHEAERAEALNVV
jgi:hypothetical protein